MPMTSKYFREKRMHYTKRKKNPVRARTQSGKNLNNWWSLDEGYMGAYILFFHIFYGSA